jgi:hypothetical protein
MICHHVDNVGAIEAQTSAPGILLFAHGNQLNSSIITNQAVNHAQALSVAGRLLIIFLFLNSSVV